MLFTKYIQEMVNKKLKRVNERTVLFAVFALLAILAIGSMFIVKPKLTGFAVIEGYNQSACVGAGYTWEDITEEVCTDISGCEIGVTGCVDTCEECADEVTGGQCTDLDYVNQIDCENANQTWEDVIEEVCTDISGCEIGVTGCVDTCEECADEVTGGQCTGDVCDVDHVALCLDETTCTDATGYWYNDECNADEECVPETCASLSYDCGDISDECGGTLSCGSCESGYSCNVGSCEEDEVEGFCGDGECPAGEDCVTCAVDCGECPPESVITGEVTGEVISEFCIFNWECSGWSECLNGVQTRECTDANACGTDDGKPLVSQSCDVPEPAETCSDEIKNQDEKGIDCGGVCEERCGFFRIMGNAVNVPVNSSKQFVQNHLFQMF